MREICPLSMPLRARFSKPARRIEIGCPFPTLEMRNQLLAGIILRIVQRIDVNRAQYFGKLAGGFRMFFS